jgi:hypothetical protein
VSLDCDGVAGVAVAEHDECASRLAESVGGADARDGDRRAGVGVAVVVVGGQHDLAAGVDEDAGACEAAGAVVVQVGHEECAARGDRVDVDVDGFGEETTRLLGGKDSSRLDDAGDRGVVVRGVKHSFVDCRIIDDVVVGRRRRLEGGIVRAVERSGCEGVVRVEAVVGGGRVDKGVQRAVVVVMDRAGCVELRMGLVIMGCDGLCVRAER